MFVFGLGLGFAVGALVTGLVAHRWPSVFNKAVAAVNSVDAQAKAKL